VVYGTNVVTRYPDFIGGGCRDGRAGVVVGEKEISKIPRAREKRGGTGLRISVKKGGKILNRRPQIQIRSACRLESSEKKESNL